MTVDKVTMRHPKTGGRFDAPATAVTIYKRSGWVVAAEDAEKAPADPEGTAGPATAEDAPKAPSRAAKTTTKEEAK